MIVCWTVLRNNEAHGRRVLDQDHPCPPGASRACPPVVDRSAQPHLAVSDQAPHRHGTDDRDTRWRRLSSVRQLCSPWLICDAATPTPSRRPDSASGSRPPSGTYARPSASWPLSPRPWPRRGKPIHEKAFVIVDGTLLPIDRIAAEAPYYFGKHNRHGMNVQVLTDPYGRLLWASLALPGSTHEPARRQTPRDHRGPHRCSTQVLGKQGVLRRRRVHMRPFRGRRLKRWQRRHNTTHAKMRCVGEQAMATLKGWRLLREAALQHQPRHRRRESRPRPSPRISVRFENAQRKELSRTVPTSSLHRPRSDQFTETTHDRCRL
jgi:hypothetical protein